LSVVALVLATVQLDDAHVRHLAEDRVLLPSKLSAQAAIGRPLLAGGDALLQETQAAGEEPQERLITVLARRSPLVRTGRDGESIAVRLPRFICAFRERANAEMGVRHHRNTHHPGCRRTNPRHVSRTALQPALAQQRTR